MSLSGSRFRKKVKNEFGFTLPYSSLYSGFFYMSRARTAPAGRGADDARLSEPLGMVWRAPSTDPDGPFFVFDLGS